MTKDNITSKHHRRGQTVLVTGAAGGVGRHVVRAALDAGFKVRAVDRVAADHIELAGLFDPHDDVDWRALDLVGADLDALLEGCAGVIHTAALVSLSESYDELAALNVQLVRDLFRACQTNKVAHLVHFSCGSIYRPEPGLRAEGDPLVADNAFEQTKIDSERVFPHNPEDTHWTVLRPALIYGPHCSAMGASIVTLPPLLRDIMPYLPGVTGGPRTNWCHVEDAAAAALHVLLNPDAFERTFNVADDTALGFGEVITSITEAYQLEVGALVPFPNTTLWTALSPLIDHDFIFDLARRLLRRRWRSLLDSQGLHGPLRPRVDRNALFYVEKDNILGADALKSIGWRAKYADFRQGIIETIRWYQQHGWAPRFDIETQVRVQDEKQSIGFCFRAHLKGYWIDGASGAREPVSLRLQVEFPTVSRLAIDLEGNIDGRIDVDGLVEGAEVRGTIEVRLLSEGGIHLEMGFDGPDAATYRLLLVCRVNPLQPVRSFNTFHGELINAHAESIGHVQVGFDLPSQLLPSLASLRLLH